MKNGFSHIILILVVLFISGILAFLFLRQNSFIKNTILPAKYLSIVSISPTGMAFDPYEKIKIKFNLPVTAHHIQQYYLISPLVRGELKQGSDPNTIIFEPQDPYPYSTTITFVLKMGLPSDSGKKLDHDYILNFNTDRDPKTVNFQSGGITAKFMSFSKDRGMDINLIVGSSINKPDVKIYKASIEDLLNSLTFIPDTYSYGSYRYGKYKEEKIDTSKLKLVKEYKEMEDNSKIIFNESVGLYLIQALKDNEVVNSAWFTLNNSGILLRQDDQNVYLAAEDLSSTQPQSGIDITFYQISDSAKVIAQHTLGNIQQYPLEYPTLVDLVIGKRGDEIFVIPVSVPNSQAELRVTENLNNKHQIFIYTDRPIYKKGDKVAFRGLVRIDNDGLYKLPNLGTKVKVYTQSTNADTIQTVNVQDDGTFWGEFKVDDKFYEGTNYLYATTDLAEDRGYSSDSTFFDVAQYVKPEFGLETNVDKSEYIRGDKIKVYLDGKYFNGATLSNQNVKYSVYRRDYYETEKAVYNKSFNLNGWGGMCGGGFGFNDEYFGELIGMPKDITLDKEGKAYIEFDTKDIEGGISQEVTFVIEKEDKNKNKIVSAKNAIVHNGQFNIFFRPGSNSVTSGEDFVNVFYTEGLDGKKLDNKSFTYNFYEEKYSSDYKKKDKNIIKSGSVSTNSEGVGVIKDIIQTSEDKSLYLEVLAKDDKGNEVESRKYIYILSKKPEFNQFGSRETLLKIVSDVGSLSPGTEAKLTINSPADLMVFTTFERGRVYKPQWLNLKKGENIFTFNVDEEFVPSISPTFSFFYDGRYYIEGLGLNVPALKKLVNVEISADKQKYSLNDTAVITITTYDANGNLIPASIGVGIVDKAIFALRKNATPPLHSSFYFFRNRSTNASSSLTWIGSDAGGRGGGGGGGELFKKDADTLYWNPNLKTGSDGKVTINVPVGYTETEWKTLVYASTDDTYLGQGELDFSVGK